MYAWTMTQENMLLAPAQAIRPATRALTILCLSDNPPARVPRVSDSGPCPPSVYLGEAASHTPRIGFPVVGGDTWIGTAAGNVGSVEARYDDGLVVPGFIATVPGTHFRIWSLGLAGPPRVGRMPGVSLVLRDTRGAFLGQGSLQASLPGQFPFTELHGPSAVDLFPFQTAAEAVITAWGQYAVFGYYDPAIAPGVVTPDSIAYPLPASLPIQGGLGMNAEYLHPWWMGLARADVARIVVRLADGRTMQAACPSPAPAPVSPGKIPRGGGSLASRHLASTCAAIPGAPGGARAFAIQLPQEFYRKAALPQGTATAYDSAGHVLGTTALGPAVNR
jgi:hypothetical protein